MLRHMRGEKSMFWLDAPVVGKGDAVDAGGLDALGQPAQPVGVAVEPGRHDFGLGAQVQPAVFDADDAAGAFDDAPQVGQDVALVTLLARRLASR